MRCRPRTVAGSETSTHGKQRAAAYPMPRGGIWATNPCSPRTGVQKVGNTALPTVATFTSCVGDASEVLGASRIDSGTRTTRGSLPRLKKICRDIQLPDARHPDHPPQRRGPQVGALQMPPSKHGGPPRATRARAAGHQEDAETGALLGMTSGSRNISVRSPRTFGLMDPFLGMFHTNSRAIAFNLMGRRSISRCLRVQETMRFIVMAAAAVPRRRSSILAGRGDV